MNHFIHIKKVYSYYFNYFTLIVLILYYYLFSHKKQSRGQSPSKMSIASNKLRFGLLGLVVCHVGNHAQNGSENQKCKSNNLDRSTSDNACHPVSSVSGKANHHQRQDDAHKLQPVPSLILNTEECQEVDNKEKVGDDDLSSVIYAINAKVTCILTYIRAKAQN